jgi:hypothetical protein
MRYNGPRARILPRVARLVPRIDAGKAVICAAWFDIKRSD